MDGLLLETVEGLGDFSVSGGAGEIWERLQAEKEAISRDILAEGPLFHEEIIEPQELEPSEEWTNEIEWRYRGSLEDRLRAINDAQDRLIDGDYGHCLDCGIKIDARRLAANPAAALCVGCQQMAESELACCAL
jgi:DnaK suppressor protein